MTQNWVDGIGHLAIVVDDIEKAKWFFVEVLQVPFYVFRETQLIAQMGPALFVAKLSKDAVDKSRQAGSLEKQVLDHYGFRAQSRDKVDLFHEHVKKHALEVVKQPYEREDGRAFYFRDPFGNLVEYFFYER